MGVCPRVRYADPLQEDSVRLAAWIGMISIGQGPFRDQSHLDVLAHIHHGRHQGLCQDGGKVLAETVLDVADDEVPVTVATVAITATAATVIEAGVQVEIGEGLAM
jgi:hypothetical protein